MPKSDITIFLTFPGIAEEAMNYYASNLPEVTISNIVRYEKRAQSGEENKVLNGSLTFKGQEIMFMDMIGACPDFSWSTSIYLNCADEAEFDIFFSVLSKDGSVMMGPEAIGHLRKVAWVTDKFGITWQPVWE